MVLNSLSHRLPSAIVEQEQHKEPAYWQQCQRSYNFQPIYRVDGSLMAIELLTAVFHPSAPGQRVSPELYFATLEIPQRLHIVAEQLTLLAKWEKNLPVPTSSPPSISTDQRCWKFSTTEPFVG